VTPVHIRIIMAISIEAATLVSIFVESILYGQSHKSYHAPASHTIVIDKLFIL
jgi:hypothetical protein